MRKILFSGLLVYAVWYFASGKAAGKAFVDMSKSTGEEVGTGVAEGLGGVFQGIKDFLSGPDDGAPDGAKEATE